MEESLTTANHAREGRSQASNCQSEYKQHVSTNECADEISSKNILSNLTPHRQNEGVHFLQLPGELRNRIYRLCIERYQMPKYKVEVMRKRPWFDEHVRDYTRATESLLNCRAHTGIWTKDNKALMATCSQVKNEFTSIVKNYKYRQVKILEDADDFEVFQRYVGNDPSELKDIRYILFTGKTLHFLIYDKLEDGIAKLEEHIRCLHEDCWVGMQNWNVDVNRVEFCMFRISDGRLVLMPGEYGSKWWGRLADSELSCEFSAA
ncbi:hypothetical protein EJ08DRAFT_147027 [Tothia fuscella]|uniref:Uncharacterized protein n=1 Tax=Tothia fuscella TaxID=1048955 RepID=A0A9P4P348_9PEZI|nr:hypothetical protein EJ08DRAFT_147027 [Tothia fuscella]